MNNILRPTIELFILLPGMLLSYLPMKRYLRMHPVKLAVLVTVLCILLCVTGGSLCCFFGLPTLWMLLPCTIVAGIFYTHTLRVSHWKSVSVFLAVCGVFSCLGSVANAIDSLLLPDNPDPWFSIGTSLFYWLICWIFVVVFWYPATHAARELLEENAFAQTWYIFWVLPVLFIALNLYMIPSDPQILYQGRLMRVYITISLVLLILLLLFYAMFYLMAKSLNKNNDLRQENQFLFMQQAQYGNLQTAIAETREARHDMRHRIQMLATLANREEWNLLKDYLLATQADLPDSDLNLCLNPAVDGVASHYALLFQKNDIPCSIALDLPVTLPVAEMDLCLVLSNLLENALEASLVTNEAKRKVRIQAYLHSSSIVLLTVENAFEGTIKEKDGIFQSSKRHGDGIGIQSVRRIAEKGNGYSRFSFENDIFRADVMLRGDVP